MTSRQPFQSNSIHHRTSIIFLTLTISTSLIILFAILYFIYYLWYSLVHRSRTSSPFDSTAPLNKLHRYSYKELKDATHNFSDSNLIGKGGSGTVYRGTFKDGKLVAIKILDSNSFQREQEFQNELNILGGLKSSPFIVSLLGYCVDTNKRFVVYEYMPNKSLQECLFSESDANNNNNNVILNWGRRFDIILSVAKALAFLHLECDPPVIHGDVKPSNVLLDSDFRAKLSDFGLSRLKTEGDQFGVDFFSQDLLKSEEVSGNLNDTPPHETDEVDFALALQSSNHSGFRYDNVDTKQWGKDWWWKQDGSGELCSKDYVNEWIGSQIYPAERIEMEKFDNVNDEHNKKHRKMQEWWNDEQHLNQADKKKKKKKKNRVLRSRKLFKVGWNLGKHFHFKRRRKSIHKSHNIDDPFSFSSHNMDDPLSRELSSTTSMRGTLCYSAPEYAGYRPIMEKADVYSFGVLVVVIISGRRPLQLNSLVTLEEANLVSWCKNLARIGNVLQVVDGRLNGEYYKDEATLCINLGLACLEKMPELRPNIGEINKILKREVELPLVPFEFSPSPPPKFLGRSRRNNRTM